MWRAPRSTLFPYTTLFRSHGHRQGPQAAAEELRVLSGAARDRAHAGLAPPAAARRGDPRGHRVLRSEEHTSELQSRPHLVCRLLLEKKKLTITYQRSRVVH